MEYFEHPATFNFLFSWPKQKNSNDWKFRKVKNWAEALDILALLLSSCILKWEFSRACLIFLSSSIMPAKITFTHAGLWQWYGHVTSSAVPYILGELRDNMASVGWRKNYPWYMVHFIYFFRNKTFLFVKIESWNFQQLFGLGFVKPCKISTHSDNIFLQVIRVVRMS